MNNRILRIELTAAGARLFEKATEVAIRVERELLEDFEPREIEELNRLFGALIASAEQHSYHPKLGGSARRRPSRYRSARRASRPFDAAARPGAEAALPARQLGEDVADVLVEFFRRVGRREALDDLAGPIDEELREVPFDRLGAEHAGLLALEPKIQRVRRPRR